MFKLPIIFAVFIITTILLVVYFVGGYHLNFNYITASFSGTPPGEKTWITDSGKQGSNSYSLKITSRGIVEYQNGIGPEKENRSFQIAPEDLDTIKKHIEEDNIFKIYTLNRTYCFVAYNATLVIDFDWITKKVNYSNCKDDPEEIQNFRQFLYSFLGITAQGTAAR